MKNIRREKIIEIINDKSIETQEDLLIELKNLGFDITQSTISRDIKLLGLVKVLDTNGKYKYALGVSQTQNNKTFSLNNERLVDTFKHSVLSIKYAVNNVVIKCYSGMAQGACVMVDSMFSDLTIGTLAGDDTVLVITANEKKAKELTEKLIALMR